MRHYGNEVTAILKRVGYGGALDPAGWLVRDALDRLLRERSPHPVGVELLDADTNTRYAHVTIHTRDGRRIVGDGRAGRGRSDLPCLAAAADLLEPGPRPSPRPKEAPCSPQPVGD